MKKLLLLLSFIFVILLSSCSYETLRFSYKETPDKYRDIKTCTKEFIIIGNNLHMNTHKGTPMIIDLTKYNIEYVKKDTTMKMFLMEYNAHPMVAKNDD